MSLFTYSSHLLHQFIHPHHTIYFNAYTLTLFTSKSTSLQLHQFLYFLTLFINSYISSHFLHQFLYHHAFYINFNNITPFYTNSCIITHSKSIITSSHILHQLTPSCILHHFLHHHIFYINFYIITHHKSTYIITHSTSVPISSSYFTLIPTSISTSSQILHQLTTSQLFNQFLHFHTF